MSTTPATPAKPANTFKSDGVAGGRKWTLDHPQGNDLLAYGMTALHALFPYWTESSYTLQPVFVEGYGTLGVTKRRVLIVDPCVISTWCRVTLATVLAHELGHGFANHHDRAADISAIPELFNFAADAELNDDLVEDKRVKWPWAPFLPANIPVPDGKGGTTGAPTGLLAEDYYRLLMESATKPQARGVCAGECGGIAGNPGEGEGELDDDDGGGKPGEKKGEGEGQTEGDLDRLFGRSDAQLEIDRLAVAEAMEAAEAKRQGTVPSGLMRIVKTLRRPAVVRWQDQLAQFFRGHITRRPGGAHASYRSPNRKQAGLGYGVGAPRMTVTHATTPVVWVAIDTSGSMGMAELVAGISEVRHLIAAAGARVRFLACDAAVHTNIDVTDGTDIGALLKGGGGTSFRPVFDRAADARHGRAGGVAAPDLLVFYTDGYGDAPEVPPPFKTIWLLSGKNTRKPAEWGDCITIPVHGV